ncbi:uncharacterized protein LOC131531178 [Onychostoma macrolepis]|uniref:uncharacterized protein LOC131531178 n=1 Tax=Onychostoma macrolepis TaxID=369639 RepID=UPI00272C8C0D|nr:uncharacterized protein LOC131531178 [Onychostoma macrolepis]
MDRPAVQLLCLEQGVRPLEAHTQDFIQLACLTHYPDRSLCVFYFTSLSERSKARVPAGGPKEDFAAFVEWVLIHNESAFTIDPVEDDIATGPTPPLPETSQPSPRSTEILPEPTADGEPEPAATEPLPSTDQVRELATSSVVEGVLVVLEGLEGSPAHTPTTEGELQLVSGRYEEERKDIFQMDLIDWFGEVQTCTPESPVSPLVPSGPESPVSPLVLSSPESPVSPLVPSSSSPPVVPPSLPLLPPLKPASSSPPAPLMPISPSAHPQSAPAMRSVPPPQDFQSPAPPSHVDPLSPLPASEPWTTPRSSDPSAPPRLLAPSSPLLPVIPLAPPGSLVPPAPPWSVVDHPPPPLLRLPRSTWVSTSSCSVSVSRPPGVVGPFSTMAPPAVNSAVGCHPGWPLDYHLAPPAPGSSLAPSSIDSTLAP